MASLLQLRQQTCFRSLALEESTPSLLMTAREEGELRVRLGEEC